MKPYLAILTAALILVGCAQNQTLMTAEQKLKKADELFAARKYARAAELYEDVYFERASGYTAYALMREADSYFRINKFTEARTAYQEFTDSFPNHADVSTAHFRIGVCLYEESLPPQYDQTETLQCIDTFRKFVEKFPNDPRYQDAIDYVRKAQYKLIEKKYLTGYIEYKMKDYSAALMYFDEVTELGNSDRLDRLSLFYSTKIYRKQDLDDKAKDSYDRLKAKYPGSKETKKLAKYFQ
jgi:outer membrane protein assembly factor BamD